MRNHDRKRIGADTAAAWTARDRKFGLVWLWVVVLVVVFVLGLLNLLIGWLINLNWVVVVVVGLWIQLVVVDEMEEEESFETGSLFFFFNLGMDVVCRSSKKRREECEEDKDRGKIVILYVG
ncbi:hypothetical protein MtrunA17_Chr3g0131511 [Medicago truncatula]|uniref:Transmembrane protein n=1 Tax=Medicago truncatula TaxID=3880 RepID=A0A396IWX9_MEDTR|nr:hypothetical protein MtrunA17_Chr3g0131511 [Medicago truncatula]